MLRPSQVMDRPRLNYNVHANRFYAVALVALNAPSHSGPWLHWLLVNIPGRDLSRAERLAEYAPPNPPRHSGPHRYLALLWEQSRKIDTEFIDKIDKNSSAAHTHTSAHAACHHCLPMLARVLTSLALLFARYVPSVCCCSVSGRAKWSYDRFLARHDAGAKLLAINFFISEFDESTSLSSSSD